MQATTAQVREVLKKLNVKATRVYTDKIIGSPNERRICVHNPAGLVSRELTRIRMSFGHRGYTNETHITPGGDYGGGNFGGPNIKIRATWKD